MEPLLINLALGQEGEEEKGRLGRCFHAMDPAAFFEMTSGTLSLILKFPYLSFQGPCHGMSCNHTPLDKLAGSWRSNSTKSSRTPRVFSKTLLGRCYVP